jgi:hypothetical protein
MIVSYKHQFVFVKTRKTAGSTLEKLMFPHLGPKDVCTGSPRDDTPRINTSSTDGHASWAQIQASYPSQFRDWFKFTIERNPWDKVVSSYYWHKEIKPARFANMDFETYVMTCELLPIDWLNYTDRQGVRRVTAVYKYEEMEEMYADLNERFRLTIPLTEVKKTKLKGDIRKERDYRKLHTNATIERVEKLFENEIKAFGYTYE